MKKVICAFLTCILATNVVSANTLTDKLKSSINPERFRMELLRCDEVLEGQTGSAISYKLSYGQKGEDYYIDYSFPVYRDRYDVIYSRPNPYITFVNNVLYEQLKRERRYDASNIPSIYFYFDENGKPILINEDSSHFDTYLKVRPEDLTVVRDGIAYILEKGKETGVFANMSEIKQSIAEGKSQKLIDERVIKPSILGKLLMADPSRYQVKFAGAAKAIYQTKAYITETFVSKNLSDGKEVKFTLFYDMKGNLSLVSEGDRLGTNLHRVVSFDQNIRDYNFECIPHFTLKPLNGKNAAKGAK